MDPHTKSAIIAATAHSFATTVTVTHRNFFAAFHHNDETYNKRQCFSLIASTVKIQKVVQILLLLLPQGIVLVSEKTERGFIRLFLSGRKSNFINYTLRDENLESPRDSDIR